MTSSLAVDSLRPRPGPVVAMRVICIILVSLLVGCAAAPPPPDPEPERPFIKLANRQMALVVFWAEPAASPAYREQVRRVLAKRLQTSYRTKVPSVEREGAPRPLGAELMLRLVEQGVDDVVTVTVEPSAEEGPISARAWVRVLQNGSRAHLVEVKKVRGKRRGRPSAERLADLLMLELTGRWTDPGAAPAMEPLGIADRLAAQGRCGQAVPIYDKVLPKRRAGTVVGIKRITESQSRYERCRAKLAVARAVAADQRARFEIRLDAKTISEQLRGALQAALQQGDFEKRMAKMTHKPVTVTAIPGSLVLRMRFHPDRYRAATRAEARFVSGRPVVYLDPFLPAFTALVDLKAQAIDALPPYARPTLESFRVMLRLEKLPRDRVDLDFAELDGRVLLPDSVRVKLGPRQEVAVKSVVPGVTRTRRIVLGPPAAASGALTSHGLLFRFFELER